MRNDRMAFIMGAIAIGLAALALIGVLSAKNHQLANEIKTLQSESSSSGRTLDSYGPAVLRREVQPFPSIKT
jgi:uncharacterized membrane protein (Fun14 family)